MHTYMHTYIHNMNPRSDVLTIILILFYNCLGVLGDCPLSHIPLTACSPRCPACCPTQAGLLQWMDPKTDGAARDWIAVYDECAKILYQEIDYLLEGQNADKFRQNFQGTDWVVVPRVFWEVSSKEVLVLEYLPGVSTGAAREGFCLLKKIA